MDDRHSAISRATANLQSACDSLRASIEDRKLVPVLGPDALTVRMVDADPASAPVKFYHLVAQRMLAKHGLPALEVDSAFVVWDLHRATTAILESADARTAARLPRVIAVTIQELQEQVQSAGVLARLARLEFLGLVVCMTPDDLLLRSWRAAHPGGSVDVVSYCPTADSRQRTEFGTTPVADLRLFHPLGRLSGGFAIHEEDALEYLHRFHEDGPRRSAQLLAELRDKDKLFLGCGLPDWMGRNLLRLLAKERLGESRRDTMEFFCALARDAGFTGFLDRFSSYSTVFPWEPDEFVLELERMSHDGTVPDSAYGELGRRPPPPTMPTRADGGGPTAFLSYASQDLEAARRLADALHELGFSTVWFDKDALAGGDDWQARIDEAIAQCDYFVPVLSRQADERREGVFIAEWRKAIARSMQVNDAFLLPIGIDELPPAQMRYERLFSGYTRSLAELHLIHAPGGQIDSDARRQLAERVSGFEREAPHV